MYIYYNKYYNDNCYINSDPRIYEQMLILQSNYGLGMQRLNFYNTYNTYLESASIFRNMNSWLQNYAVMYFRNKYGSFCEN